MSRDVCGVCWCPIDNEGCGCVLKQPEALRLASELDNDADARALVYGFEFPELRQSAAELRRLHTEVERLKSMTAMTMGIGRGDGNLFVHGDYDSIKAAQSLVFRAERMKKALKDIQSLSSINSAMNPNSSALTAMLGDIHHIADAALSKESIND